MAKTAKNNGDFSDIEKEAMKTRAKELRDEAKRKKTREQGEKDVIGAISVMTESDKNIAQKLHEIVKDVAPELMPKTWYGMPAYANKEGKVVVFFKGQSKFESRFPTLGFDDAANLDEGNLWPTSYGLTKITDKEEKIIRELITRAIS